MSEVKRYICTDNGSPYESYGEPIMVENEAGNYVLHSDYEKLKAQLENKSKDYGCFSMKELPSEKIKIVPSAYANEIPVLLLSFESYNYLLKYFKEKELK